MHRHCPGLLAWWLRKEERRFSLNPSRDPNRLPFTPDPPPGATGHAPSGAGLMTTHFGVDADGIDLMSISSGRRTPHDFGGGGGGRWSASTTGAGSTPRDMPWLRHRRRSTHLSPFEEMHPDVSAKVVDATY